MEPFITHTGIVAPLDRVNVDTDAIVPKQFLRKIERTGFGQHLFHQWRYLDYEGTRENPGFVLNQPPFSSATVLLARDNFGCGSSREHAPWALGDYGFKVIAAPSFADIFFNNCVKNGLLPVVLPTETVAQLFKTVEAAPGIQFTIDLSRQTLAVDGDRTHRFEINSFAKYCLLNGLDQIGWTLQFEEKIASHEAKIKSVSPWLG